MGEGGWEGEEGLVKREAFLYPGTKTEVGEGREGGEKGDGFRHQDCHVGEVGGEERYLFR